MQRSTLRVFLFPVLFITLGSALLSCSGKQVDENDPAALMKEAEEEIKSDHYQLAIDKLKTIKNKFPYSSLAVDAQLRLADVLYMQESFAEAAAAYETFRDLHPKHGKVVYAMFRIAKSYYNDMPSPISRDMTPAQKAQDAYQNFLKRFPEAPEAAEARKDLEEVRRSLAEKEIYIANFYYKREFYESAKPRFQKVVDLYPEVAAAQEAREKIAKINQMPPKPKKEEPAKETK